MVDVLLFAINAVVPILLLLVLGYFLAQKGFLSKKFLVNGNSLVFRVLLPLTIFHNIYVVDSVEAINWSLVLFSLAVIIALCGLGWVCSAVFIKHRESKGVFIQCAFRSNFAIIGLPLAEALGGAPAAAMAAILSAFTIPLFNVLAVIVLTVYSKDKKAHTVGKIIHDIITNPLIIAAVVGLLFLLIRTWIPVSDLGQPVFSIQTDMPFVYKSIVWLHQSSSPLALIIMGGMLDFSQIRSKLNYIVGGTVFRLILAPTIGLCSAYLCRESGLISCGPGEYGALIALFGSPVAVSSAIMASAMGCDDELARQYTVWTSLFSMLSLFLISAALRSFALI